MGKLYMDDYLLSGSRRISALGPEPESLLDDTVSLSEAHVQ